MAETFTINNNTESEVLSAEEQDSLEVGEKLVEEHEGLLAGKYENAQELEKAYIELQKKLGHKMMPRHQKQGTKNLHKKKK